MAKKQPGTLWEGFTPEESSLLSYIDHLGNNGWARNGQTEEVMPIVLSDCDAAGLSLARIKDAMATIGYDKHSLHQLDRWESKRTTGKFGP
ncbi:hypothetical protein ACFTWF_34905 [Rhodococcus sp. NPDC056960]|uniref:hypothetical protein n=1 Tax=Rhodococcus sp. NPDC056960 TaxID=3345982 RepID=UPI003635855B